MKTERNLRIDFLRTIGIILVVLGHCSSNSNLVRIVYLFHLPLFFFVSGYFFNNNKDEKFFDFFVKKLKKYYLIFIKFGIFYLLFHNIFVRLNILNMPIYSLKDFAFNFANIFTGSSNEFFMAAMWYLATSFVNIILFKLAFCLENKNKYIKYFFLLFFTILGIFLVVNNFYIGFMYQISLVTIPFTYFGYFCKNVIKDKYNIYISILFFIIFYFAIKYTNHSVELSRNIIGNHGLFYLCGCGGIYIILYLYKFLPFKKYCNFLNFIGKNTSYILCLHILCYKIIDYLYITFFSHDYSLLNSFTTSYKGGFWSLIYTFFGILIPLLYVLLKEKIIKNKFRE